MEYHVKFFSFVFECLIFLTFFQSCGSIVPPTSNVDNHIRHKRDFFFIGNSIVNNTEKTNVLTLLKTNNTNMQTFLLTKKSTTVTHSKPFTTKKSKITTPKRLDSITPTMGARNASQAKVAKPSTGPSTQHSPNTTVEHSVMNATTGYNDHMVTDINIGNTVSYEQSPTTTSSPIIKETSEIHDISTHISSPTTETQTSTLFSRTNNRPSTIQSENFSSPRYSTTLTDGTIPSTAQYTTDDTVTPTTPEKYHTIEHAVTQEKTTGTRRPVKKVDETTETPTKETMSRTKETPNENNKLSTVVPLPLPTKERVGKLLTSQYMSSKTTLKTRTKKDSTTAKFEYETSFMTNTMETMETTTISTDLKDPTSESKSHQNATNEINAMEKNITTKDNGTTIDLPSAEQRTQKSESSSEVHSSEQINLTTLPRQIVHSNVSRNLQEYHSVSTVYPEKVTTIESPDVTSVKTSSDATISDLVTSISSARLTAIKDGDDTYWPIAMALTIAVPTIIVVGVTITVIHKKRKLERAHSSLSGYITPPMEYDV